MIRKFQVRDIVFLAVLAAVTTLFGALAMPVMRPDTAATVPARIIAMICALVSSVPDAQ